MRIPFEYHGVIFQRMMRICSDGFQAFDESYAIVYAGRMVLQLIIIIHGVGSGVEQEMV